MDLSQVRKFEDLSFAQWIAVGNKVGGLDTVIGLLQGKLEISLEKVARIFFDWTGRCISPKEISANICDPNKDCRLCQPDNDYAGRNAQVHKYLGVNTEITEEQFKAETQRLLALIRDDSQIANIANGVWLPVALPRLQHDDLGAELEYYLAAVAKSYVDVFPEREFRNHRKGTLNGAVSVVEGSRHEELIERMKRGPVIAIYFPNPLQGFSVTASRKQMTSLPKGLILSGIDAAVATLMYPDVLGRDLNTPGLDLAALSWRSAEYSLYFRTGDDGLLGFASTGHLACAHASSSGGLLFVG